MNIGSKILKNLLLPLLVKSTKVDVASFPDAYWEQFSADFIHYDINAKPIFASLYQLELQNPEDVFEKLPIVYSYFIKALAEEYVLENEIEMSAKLLESNNETFLKEVSFLKIMKSVITKLERQELKKNLPILYDQLVFDLDEETLRQVAKKKSREDLRAKFKKWDEEIVEREPVLMENSSSYDNANEDSNKYKHNQPETKVISLSWIKYLVAACFLLTAGILYFNRSSAIVEPTIQPTEENFVTTDELKLDLQNLKEINSTSKIFTVLEESGLGFSTSPKKIAVTLINQKDRIQSIVIALKNNQDLQSLELIKNKAGDGPRAIALKEQNKILSDELGKLNKLENKYIFDGKTLTLYETTAAENYRLLQYEDSYYLYKVKDFCRLKISSQPQPYKKETDSLVLNALDRIIFDNEQ